MSVKNDRNTREILTPQEGEQAHLSNYTLAEVENKFRLSSYKAQEIRGGYSGKHNEELLLMAFIIADECMALGIKPSKSKVIRGLVNRVNALIPKNLQEEDITKKGTDFLLDIHSVLERHNILDSMKQGKRTLSISAANFKKEEV